MHEGFKDKFHISSLRSFNPDIKNEDDDKKHCVEIIYKDIAESVVKTLILGFDSAELKSKFVMIMKNMITKNENNSKRADDENEKTEIKEFPKTSKNTTEYDNHIIIKQCIMFRFNK